MNMNPEWFEEKNGWDSRFYQIANSYYGVSPLAAINFAFRTLLAEDKEAGVDSYQPHVHGDVLACMERIATLERKVKRLRKLSKYPTDKTPDPIKIVISSKLAPEWIDMVNKLKTANADLAAYRARVEAGKVVYLKDSYGDDETFYDCSTKKWPRDNKTALLIDVADIAPAVEQEPTFMRFDMDNKMVNIRHEERTGEADRRKAPWQSCGGCKSLRKEGTRGYRDLAAGSYTVAHARSNDRRKGAGRQS